MTTAGTTSNDRIKVSPEIEAEFVGETAKARLARSFLRFAEALLAEDVDAIEAVVLPDVRCHELEEDDLDPRTLRRGSPRRALGPRGPDTEVEREMSGPTILRRAAQRAAEADGRGLQLRVRPCSTRLVAGSRATAA